MSISLSTYKVIDLNSITSFKVDKDLVRSASVGEKPSDWAPAVFISREESMAATEINYENNNLSMGNITTLDYKATIDQYNFIESLVESGDINNFNFHGFNGTEQAETAEQYLFWLQAHAQEIGGGEAG